MMTIDDIDDVVQSNHTHLLYFLHVYYEVFVFNSRTGIVRDCFSIVNAMRLLHSVCMRDEE